MSLGGAADPRAPEPQGPRTPGPQCYGAARRIMSLENNPVTSSVMEHATFGLVAQYLNYLNYATACPITSNTNLHYVKLSNQIFQI